MSTIGRRVALLARPGIACDRLRGALADAGAQLVLEADPLTLDPAMLDAVQPQVVLVALDTQTEDALDRFEAALQDPSIEVIYEEAELAARREGWEAARWVRHLAAKLHRHGDVLPPGSQSATASTADAGSDRPLASEPALDFDLEADAVAESESESEVTSRAEPEAVSTTYAFDPLLAEIAFDQDASRVDTGLGADSPVADASAVFDPSLNFAYYGDFDSIGADLSADVAPTSGMDAFSFDQGGDLPLEGLSLDALRSASRAVSQDQGLNQTFDGDFTAAAGSGLDVAAPATLGPDVAAAKPVGDSTKRVLELVSNDDDQVLARRGSAEAGDEDAAAEHRFKRDLASLESRIADMELVDDRIVKGPAQANGAVLVMAGIGGPDAVRQLLGALPQDFPRPVLVQQRLDGGRYDKLVAQMQRATVMLVKLAEPGLPAIAGVIYILPAGVGIKVADAGIEFTDGGDDVLAALPSADSAVLLLSGSDPAQVDAVMNHSWAGALVIGQAPDGCYDAAAPNALVARGGDAGQPAELAERLSERWRS